MTEHDFFYFHEVSKYLNFTEAARHLYISQPALSKQISRLEAEVGFPLFIRNKQEVKLAPGGMVLLNEYGQLFSLYGSILERARLANEGKWGNLRIGIQEGQDLDEHLLALIRSFRDQYAGIHLEIVSCPQRTLLEEIHKAQLDIGLCLNFDPGNFIGMNTQVVATMPSYIILSNTHPLAAKEVLDFNLLNTETLLVVNDDLASHGKQFALENCHKCGILPQSVRKVSSYATLYLNLSMGDGFVMMNRNVWYSNQTLRFFPLPDAASVTQIACWHAQSKNPAIPFFTAFIQDK